MFLFTLVWSIFVSAAFAAPFGYTDQGAFWTIDTGAKLVIQVNKGNGDIISMKYNGVEYNGYQRRNTQVEAGLGKTEAVTSIQQFSSPDAIIKVSVTYKALKHYLVVRANNDNVYIFTNKADSSFAVHRYIARIKAGIFSHNTSPSSNLEADFYPDDSKYIEASDVSGRPDGTTVSKHYTGGPHGGSSQIGRTIDYDFVGYSKAGAGVFMVRCNRELATGGPFFRSLQRRGSSIGEDLYDIYFYNMGTTDVERMGLQGPSVLSFTDGSTPDPSLFAKNADWGWFDTLGIDGWVPASGRGCVAGVGLSNMKPGLAYTVGLSSPKAQYWTPAAGEGGAWQIKNALPGTYTMTVYKEELEVYNASVTVKAGDKVALNTVTLVDPSDTKAIWRIGDWDGTPAGFLNFEEKPWKPTYMHPSDSRIATWDGGVFTVGTSRASSFPGYVWKEINDGVVVHFRLSAEQLSRERKVRIGITQAYLNGRPMVTVNNWKSDLPQPSDQARTRSLTVGTYRGNNAVFEFAVPSTAWVVTNSSMQVLTINIGSGSPGKQWLSGAVSFDCVELV